MLLISGTCTCNYYKHIAILTMCICKKTHRLRYFFSELLNNLGNFINRALKFVNDTYQAVIPEIEVAEEDKVLFAQIGAELRDYINSLEKVKFNEKLKATD